MIFAQNSNIYYENVIMVITFADEYVYHCVLSNKFIYNHKYQYCMQLLYIFKINALFKENE